MSSEILQALHGLTEPIVAPHPAWNFLDPSPSVRTYAGDAASLVAELQEHISDEELEEASIVARDDNGEVQPSPFLSGSDCSFLFLRLNETDPPIGMISAGGYVSNDEPPAFEACADYITLAWSRQNENQLIAVFDMNSLSVLRQLRLPTTVAAGLGAMDGRQLRELLGVPDVLDDRPVENSQPGSPPPECDLRCRDVKLVLAAWDVAGLSRDEPAEVREVVVRLARVGRDFGFDLSPISVWRPSEDEIRGILHATQLRDRELTHYAMCSSSEESTWSIESYCNREYGTPQNPEDFSTARGRLRKELGLEGIVVTAARRSQPPGATERGL
jgi:hypothetical protein